MYISCLPRLDQNGDGRLEPWEMRQFLGREEGQGGRAGLGVGRLAGLCTNCFTVVPGLPGLTARESREKHLNSCINTFTCSNSGNTFTCSSINTTCNFPKTCKIPNSEMSLSEKVHYYLSL